MSNIWTSAPAPPPFLPNPPSDSKSTLPHHKQHQTPTYSMEKFYHICVTSNVVHTITFISANI